MTMTTCSVNLTNCDLAPRLSLCPDSGLLVAIILGVPSVDNWNIPIIIIIIIIILLIIMIIAVFLTVRSINLKVISRWGKIISRWGKIISRWGQIIQKNSQAGVKPSKNYLNGSIYFKVVNLSQIYLKVGSGESPPTALLRTSAQRASTRRFSIKLFMKQ